MNKVAIYCRLSKEDEDKQVESESIQNQKSLLINYAIERSWEIYNIYCDEDYSGSDSNRPEFNVMLRDAKSKKFDIILCKSQARFTRDMELVEKYIHNKFINWGIRFVAVADNADTNIKGNKKARQINGLINEWYLEDLSENIKAVLYNKMRQGQYIGSFTIYGYLKNPENHNALIVDQEAAKVVRMIYSMYLDGYGTFKIARELNESGISNPTYHKLEMGIIKKVKHPNSTTNHLWSEYTIKGILRNRMYTGDMVQGRIRNASYKSKKKLKAPQDEWIIVENTHEPIISKEIFNAVQKRYKQRAKPSYYSGKVHYLTGKVKCIHCGSAMHRNRAKNHFYLKCKKYLLQSNESQCKYGVQVSEIEKIILEKINGFIQLYINQIFGDKIISKHEDDTTLIKFQNKLKEIQSQISEINTITSNLYIDKVKGIVSEEQFVSMNSAFQKQKIDKEIELNNIRSKLDKIDSAMDYTVDNNELIKKYSDISELSHEVISELIDYIDVGKNVNKQILIGIHWLI